MHKIWYVFLEGGHQGPYTEQQVIDLLGEGKIEATTAVWREGRPGWIPVGEVEDFLPFFIPAIPEIPELEDGPPPLPALSDIGPDLDTERESEAEIPSLGETISVSEHEDEIITDAPLGKGSKKKYFGLVKLASIIAFSLLLFFAGAIGYLNVPAPGKDFSLARFKLPAETKAELMKTLHSKISGDPTFDFAFSKNQNQIIGTTQILDPLNLTIRLKSFSGKVIGGEEVEMISKGKGKHGLVVLSRTVLKKGSKPLFGRYLVEVKAKTQGRRAKIYRFLKDHGVHKTLMPNFIENYSYQGEMLYYPGVDTEFRKELTNFKRKKFKKLLEPLEDQIEKYKTLVSLIEKVQFMLKKHLERLHKGSQIKKFEGEYASEVGPILQGLILDNISLQEKYTEDQPKKAYGFKAVSVYGRKIGGLASDIVTSILKKKKVVQKDRASLEKKFKRRIDELIDLGVLRISRLEEEISTISLSN